MAVSRLIKFIVLLAEGCALLTLGGCAERFSDSLSAPATTTPASRAGDLSDSGTESDDRGDNPLRPAPAGELQQKVMDFSDHYVSALWQELDRYIAGQPDISKQVQAQRLKVALATASMTIAASKDPRANLLDMAVFISAGKWAADRYWIPEVLGEKAAGLRAVYNEADADIRDEVKRLLTRAQRSDLDSLIAEWKEQGPGPREVMDVRLRNLDGVVLSHFEESASAKGLLASVRRLLGNVNQSLLYGERMMFYLERTPLVLSQQSDLTVDRVAERFPIATVNPNFDQWVDLANTLPQQIGKIFEAREQTVREVLPEIRDSLRSFAHITDSLQSTVTSADSLAGKLGKLPFDQKDYATAFEGAAVSLDNLNQIVAGVNRLLEEDKTSGAGSPVNRLARVLDQRMQGTLDAVFQRVALLIAMFIGGLLVVVVVARLLFRAPAKVGEAKPGREPVRVSPVDRAGKG